MSIESKHMKFSALVVVMAWVFARSVLAAEFVQKDLPKSTTPQSIVASN